MTDAAELRLLIREVIAEEVRALESDAMKAGAPGTPAPAPVRIVDDADLGVFARRVLALAVDPRTARPLPVPPPAQGRAGKAAGRELRIEQGVVTEAMLKGLARSIERLILASGVPVAPLARDLAWTLCITIERTRG